MITPLHLRVFLSSPGDVTPERAIARRLLREAPTQPWLKGRVTIDVVSWDDPAAPTPMDAGQAPQLSVNRHHAPPSQCDLTIAILWSRLGTPLAAPEYPDGSLAASGTVWEIDDALSAGKAVWLYRRTEAPSVPLEDPQFEAKRRQYMALKAWFDGFINSHGAHIGGVNHYDDEHAFERSLARHLESELRSRLEGHGAPTSPGTSRTAFRLFLATAADDMRTARLRLESQLRDLPTVEVLREVPPPLDERAHTMAVREAIGCADLCVHLIGTNAGFPVEWSDSDFTTTYPMEQLRLGLELGKAQLVLQAPEFAPEGIADVAYRQLVESVMLRTDSQDRLEITKTNRARMLSTVLEKKRCIEDAAAMKRANALSLRSSTTRLASSVFVDFHARDAGRLESILSNLRARGVTPLLLPTDAPGEPSPAQHAALFAEYVRKANRVLIVFGRVARHWVDERLNEAFKLVLSERLPTRIAVYQTPEDAVDRDVQFPGLCTVIHDTWDAGPDPLGAFLREDVAA